MTLDCQKCGACCTSIAWNNVTMPFVPLENKDQKRLGKLLKIYSQEEPFSNYKCMLKIIYADPKESRCAALSGQVGCEVSCKIYEKRPDTCRAFVVGSSECLRARRRNGID